MQVERRVGQRFSFLLPVSFREISTGMEGVGITQDLSSRGVFFLTDTALQGGEIELTLKMPAEITLGESMRVRCRGQILRMTKPADKDSARSVPGSTGIATAGKMGVAVRLDGYEYLAEPASSAAFPRVSSLHNHREDERALPVQPSGRAV